MLLQVTKEELQKSFKDPSYAAKLAASMMTGAVYIGMFQKYHAISFGGLTYNVKTNTDGLSLQEIRSRIPWAVHALEWSSHPLEEQYIEEIIEIGLKEYPGEFLGWCPENPKAEIRNLCMVRDVDTNTYFKIVVCKGQLGKRAISYQGSGVKFYPEKYEFYRDRNYPGVEMSKEQTRRIFNKNKVLGRLIHGRGLENLLW